MKDMQHKPETVKEIQDYLKKLYSDVNKDRQFEYIYSYFFRNASYLSRTVPKENLDSVPRFIKTFSWLFSLANQLDIDIQNAFQKKFPDVCPYCIHKPCMCSRTNKKPLIYIQEWKVQEELESKFNIASAATPRLSMDKCVTNINELYPANMHVWKAAGPTFHFFRLFEELGEVHEAYTSYCKNSKTKSEIENELADCFAWILSSWGIRYPDRNLQDAFITYYIEGCPVCKLKLCGCKDYSDRGGILVKLEELKEYRGKLEELLMLAPQYKDDLTDIIKDVEYAERNGTTPVAVSAVKKGDSKLKELSIPEVLGKVEKSGKSIESILSSALALAKSFDWM